MTIDDLRKPKIFKMAIFDLVGTFIIALIVHLSLWLYDKPKEKKRNIMHYMISLMIIFIMFLGIGIIFHKIFGIKSALSAHLGLNDDPR